MFAPEDLAVALVSWRARFDQSIVRWPEGGAVLQDRFVQHLSRKASRLHSGDFAMAVRGFAAAKPRFLDWYECILSPFQDTLVLEDGAPRLRTGALGPWRAVSGKVDPDALVALALARRFGDRPAASEVVARLPQWGFFAAMADHGLARVVDEGLADIHVHFEASDPMPLLWLRLATGRTPAEELAFYSDAEMARLGLDEPARERRLVERGYLETSEQHRRALMAALGLAHPTPDTEGDVLAPLHAEREMLVLAWQSARAVHPPDDLPRILDQYLFRKNLFLRRHQQSANLGPGLDRFRDFLDRGETIGERRRKKVRPAIRRQRFDRMLSLATEPPALRYLELRITPQASIAAWRNLLVLWRDRYAVDGSPTRGVPVRFVVHFVRSPDASGTADEAMQFGALRRRLDRQSATLQLFRTTFPDLAGCVTGIDVANFERGCPPEVFAPHLALLRGDGRLAGPLSGSRSLEGWSRLEERREHLPPPTLPPLGLTYHAGEDFPHPVDGMRAMSGLLANLLRPGDRIGHGLAVGIDVRRFQSERGRPPLSRGSLLDDLVWLRMQTARFGAWTGEIQVGGDHAIDDLSREIYGRRQAAPVLERALDSRFSMPRLRPAGTPMPEPDVVLVEREAFEPAVAALRAAPARTEHTQALFGMVGLLPEVQGRVIRAIRDAGVVVEANPTSNLVTGAVDRLSEHPFVRYLDALDGQVIVSINTDDPGVFGTRLDVEFGLMFEALLEAGYDRLRALDILERSRRLAWQNAFCDAPTLRKARRPS